jgi:quercetin dioxygenase-like cupin family protein
MMSINGFAYRIGTLSKPPGMTVKAVRRAMPTASVPLVAAAIALGGSPAIAQNQDQVRVVFEHALPNVEAKRIVAVMVSYPPGGKSLAHRHAASAFIYAYVLSGAIRSQVGNDLTKVYHAGEGFYEMPGSHHRISENASDKEPASLLAVFVVDSKDDPLTTPDQEPRGSSTEPQGTSEPTRFSSLVARSPALHRYGGDQRHRLRPKADISALVLLRSGA